MRWKLTSTLVHQHENVARNTLLRCFIAWPATFSMNILYIKIIPRKVKPGYLEKHTQKKKLYSIWQVSAQPTLHFTEPITQPQKCVIIMVVIAFLRLTNRRVAITHSEYLQLCAFFNPRSRLVQAVIAHHQRRRASWRWTFGNVSSASLDSSFGHDRTWGDKEIQVGKVGKEKSPHYPCLMRKHYMLHYPKLRRWRRRDRAMVPNMADGAKYKNA